MRIINTVKKFKFILPVLAFCLGLLPFLTGCVQRNDLKQPQDYLEESRAYYRNAITAYKKAIAKGEDLDRLYLELGQLYYLHGDFQEAQEAFKKTEKLEAKKFLAISYYRLGNFTDALELFAKNDLQESEYLYYYGLTCEKMNLFDKALEIYNKIKEENFRLKAKQRIELIEKLARPVSLKELSPQADRILKNAPAIKEYPQAGALILLCDEKIATTPQNTQVASLHYIIKILNERGKEAFSETQIDYDSTYEKVELEYARTIKPDGTVAEVGRRHIRDVSKYLNFPLYSNARVCIISFPEIAEGAAIEYKAKVYRNQLINKKDFVVSYPVQSTEPIIAANFSVIVPAGQRPPNIKILNEKYNNFGANLKPAVKQEAGSLTYSWQFKKIPQIIPEPNMPASVEINPTILISTFDNWGEVYNWWWQLAQDKIKADSAIKDKVEELIRGRQTEESKARAIYNFCAREIRYVAVAYGSAGYEPHYASDIFRNKYGDCKDQAILLVTMLKEAGLEGSVLLIATKDYYDLVEDFPSALFDHCIGAVYLKGKIVFLDPTAETCPLGDLPTPDQERKVLIFEGAGYKIEKTPLYPPEHNLVKEKLRLKVNNDETIAAQKSVFTYGLYDQAQRYWLLYTQPELIRESIGAAIQEVSIGAKLIKYNIENLEDLNTPVALKYEFWGPEYFTKAGTLRIMPQLSGFDTGLVAKEERKYPIEFAALESKETVLEVEIPDNFIVKYIPDTVVEDSPWLKFTVEYNYKNNRIYFREESLTKKIEVFENEYPDFKKFLQGLAKKIKQRIVLERVR